MHGGSIAPAYSVLEDRYTTVEVWKHTIHRITTFYVVDQADFKLYMYQDINKLKSEWYIRFKRGKYGNI